MGSRPSSRGRAEQPPVTTAPAARPAATPLPRRALERAVATAVPLDVARTPAPPPPAAAVIPATGRLAGRVTNDHGQPVAFANVIVRGTRRGAMTDENGYFAIPGAPAGAHAVDVLAIGYTKTSVENVRLTADQTTTVDVRMGPEIVVQNVEEVQVRAERRIGKAASSTSRRVTSERLSEIPVDHLGQAIARKPGPLTKDDALHFRGGRSGEVQFQVDGVPVAPAPATGAVPAPAQPNAPARPPVVPTTGGTALPNDEAFDSMFFRNYGVNPFVAADEDPLSTFAVDVDAASYTVTRRYLQLGELPPADAVRTEEFVNFFPQGYPRFTNDDFRIVTDGAPSPFGRGYQLLRIGLKGREIDDRNRKPARLTFVIDVSGSMQREDRLELVKRALRLLVDQLRADDEVGIVVYGTTGRVLLEPLAMGGAPARVGRVSRPMPGARSGAWGGRERLLAAIDALQPEGSTNAAEGLRLGYEMARRALRPDAINRIVLCSDGVANVGVTGPESILAQVRKDADRGIHLTTIGFGMGNYNDVLMEQLADHGDGNHYYVDEIGEARRVFVENLTGTLQTIAKDAKVQVEFDSTRVLRYRLLGFENRDVADRDFRNDKVDAGEIGAGHEVTALYEVKLAPGVTSGTFATVRLRWARPEHEGAGAPVVREIEQRVDVGSLARRFEDASAHFRLDAAVAEFAEILKGSYWAKESRMGGVLPVARSAARDLRSAPADEFVKLVEKAATRQAGRPPAPAGDER